MDSDPERLRERLLDLERAHQRERTLRRQSESLLQGLIPLGQAQSVDDIFTTLTELLHQHLSFEHAFLIAPPSDDAPEMTPVVSTDPRLAHTRWTPGEFFARVRSQGPTSTFNIGPIEEWRRQPADVQEAVQSALHIPLSEAMLICTDSQRGTFGADAVAFARRVAPVAAQALQNIEKHQREIQFLRIEQEHQISFHRLIEHLPDAVWISQQGRITYANQALLDLFDLDDLERLRGTPITELIHPKDVDFFSLMLSHLDGVGATSDLHEFRLNTDTDPPAHLEVVALNLRFPDGLAQLCVGRDIYHRKEMTTRLMQMDRMITAGTLAAGVGHEINNPLSYVISNIDYVCRTLEQFARSNTTATAQQLSALYEALRDAYDGGRQIADIVADLRIFSGSSTETELQPVDIPSVIDSTRRMVKKTIEHKARYVEHIDDDLPAVMATHAKLAQVLLNLLTNAAQAIDSGAAADNLVELKAYQQDEWVVLQVSDTGQGIPEEHRSQLFNLFFTTRDPDEGTGLGLPISHRNITSFGGHIEFESAPGQGTSFRVFLPIASPAKGQDRATTPSPLDTSIQLLVIDDEPAICASTERMLRNHAAIMTATGAREALQIIEDDPSSVDLILCDVFMPGLSGLEFHRRLSELAPDLAGRLAFMTGGIRSPGIQQSLDLLDNPLLQKPFTRRALLDTLADLSDQ